VDGGIKETIGEEERREVSHKRNLLSICYFKFRLGAAFKNVTTSTLAFLCGVTLFPQNQDK
jgi:hypothetical protein